MYVCISSHSRKDPKSFTDLKAYPSSRIPRFNSAGGGDVVSHKQLSVRSALPYVCLLEGTNFFIHSHSVLNWTHLNVCVLKYIYIYIYVFNTNIYVCIQYKYIYIYVQINLNTDYFIYL